MKNIRVYARLVGLLSKVLIPVMFLIFVLRWTCDGFYNELYLKLMYSSGALSPAVISKISMMSFLHRVLGFLVDGISVVLLVYVLVLIIKLMQLFQVGEIFSSSTAALLSKMSRIVFVLALYEPIKRTLLSFIVTMHNAPGQRMISVEFGSGDLINILIVGLFVVITAIMQEGYRLKTENDLTV